MRTISMRLILSAVVAAVFLAPTIATASSSSATTVGRLKLCTYSAGDVSEGSQTFIVKVVAAGGGGVRGTLRVAGGGVNRTVPFRLKKGGIGLVAIPLTPPVTLTLTTKLVLKPVNPTRTDHVTFTASDPNTAAPRGCVAR